jgi:hypothetical protein
MATMGSHEDPALLAIIFWGHCLETAREVFVWWVQPMFVLLRPHGGTNYIGSEEDIQN